MQTVPDSLVEVPASRAEAGSSQAGWGAVGKRRVAGYGAQVQAMVLPVQWMVR